MNFNKIESKKLFQLFGDDIEIILYDIDVVIAKRYFEEIYQEGLRLQKIFNFFDPKSELSLLNKRRTLRVSEELLKVIKHALKYCKETLGLYDISKGMEIRDRKQNKPLTFVACTYNDIEIDGNNITFLHPDVCIDLGSIAKGFIVDKLIAFIRSKGIESAFIDARGDMRIFGRHLEIVEIQHPRNKHEALSPIILENNAIATSGDYNQYYGTMNRCHIIGKKDIISVSVIAETLMEADVLATCIFLLGEQETKSFLLQHKKTASFIITKDLKSQASNQFYRYLLEQ